MTTSKNWDNSFLEQRWVSDNCFESSSDSNDNFKEGKEYLKKCALHSNLLSSKAI